MDSAGTGPAAVSFITTSVLPAARQRIRLLPFRSELTEAPLPLFPIYSLSSPSLKIQRTGAAASAAYQHRGCILHSSALLVNPFQPFFFDFFLTFPRISLQSMKLFRENFFAYFFMDQHWL